MTEPIPGPTQADYDAIVAERDGLAAQLAAVPAQLNAARNAGRRQALADIARQGTDAEASVAIAQEQAAVLVDRNAILETATRAMLDLANNAVRMATQLLG